MTPFSTLVVVVGEGHAWRQLDHVLSPQRAHDGVVAAVRAEDDPVRRGQSGNVDRVVTFRAIDRDGVRTQAGAGEVADHLDCVAASRGVAGRRIRSVDADLFDFPQFCND